LIEIGKNQRAQRSGGGCDKTSCGVKYPWNGHGAQHSVGDVMKKTQQKAVHYFFSEQSKRQHSY